MEPLLRVELSHRASKAQVPIRGQRHGGGGGSRTLVFRVVLAKRYDRSQLQAGSCIAVSSFRPSVRNVRGRHLVSPRSPPPLLLPGCGDQALLSARKR